MIHVGTTFQLCGSGNHPRIVISNPKSDTDKVLVCNLTDQDHDPESCCRFSPGEHPLVTKPSTIAMGYLVELPAANIVNAYKEGKLVFFEDFAPPLIDRITAAILGARNVPPKFKKYLQPSSAPGK